mgnify:CR=1 FL=1|jgi:hypothetical protein
MLLFEKLQNLGYHKAGNWYIKGCLSLNLFTKEIKSSNKKVVFNYEFKNEIDIDKVEEIYNFISSFET